MTGLVNGLLKAFQRHCTRGTPTTDVGASTHDNLCRLPAIQDLWQFGETA